MAPSQLHIGKGRKREREQDRQEKKKKKKEKRSPWTRTTFCFFYQRWGEGKGKGRKTLKKEGKKGGILPHIFAPYIKRRKGFLSGGDRKKAGCHRLHFSVPLVEREGGTAGPPKNETEKKGRSTKRRPMPYLPFGGEGGERKRGEEGEKETHQRRS